MMRDGGEDGIWDLYARRERRIGTVKVGGTWPGRESRMPGGD